MARNFCSIYHSNEIIVNIQIVAYFICTKEKLKVSFLNFVNKQHNFQWNLR